MKDDCRQFPLSGHVSFCRQLQVLCFVLFPVLTGSSDEFKIRLLWLLIICFVLFMQL